MLGIVAVHCGAGYHSAQYQDEYNKLSRQAASKGIQVLKNGGTAVDAVKDAVIVLEDHPRTNCGYGSNLTLAGEVENDASIMNGSDLIYGGCGAVKRLKNPIELAYELCMQQTIKQSCGLVPPSLLVDTGAVSYAKGIGLKVVSQKSLVTRKSAEQYKKYMQIYKKCKGEEDDECLLLDTVGAVCMDENGDIAAACSSGGIILKRSGRVGQAALYGSGTWADSLDKNEPSIAVSTSGCGEYLVKTQLAKEIARDLKHCQCPTTALHKSITDNFINSVFLRSVEQKLCGALVLHKSGDDLSLMWGHSTETMSVGYMSTLDKKPVGLISKMPRGSQVGQTINIGGCQY